MESLDSTVLATFEVGIVVSVITIIKKWFCSSYSLKPDLKILLIKFFICHEAIGFARRIQMPYKYQMYLEYGLSNSEISEIIGYTFICTAIWNLLMPIALRKLGHANLLSLVALSYAASSIFHSMGTYSSFALSACIFGMAQPTSMMSMQDWWMNEEMKLPSEYNAHFIFHEYRLLLSLIATMLVSPLSTCLVEHFGISSAFTLTPMFFVASIVLFQMLMKKEDTEEEENNEKEEDNSVMSDLKDLFSLLCKEKKTIVLPIFIDMAFAISTFLFSQHSNAFLFTKDHKPKMGYVSGSFGVIELIGAMFISYLTMMTSKSVGERTCNSFTKMISILTFCTSCLMIGIYYFYQNKIIIYIILCIDSFISSGTSTNLILMRKKYYPGKIRNYIMTIVKLPTSLLSFFIYWYWKTQDIKIFALLGGIAMLICFALSVLLVFINKNEKVEKSMEDNAELINIEIEEEEENKEKNDIEKSKDENQSV